ncbi:hypothetical protein Tco_1476473 [Tanacetum coccineum]
MIRRKERIHTESDELLNRKNLKCLLMMKRWPERFKRNRKQERRRKGWLRKKLLRLHSPMSVILFRQDSMQTRFLLRRFKKKREKISPSKRETSCFMIPLLYKGDFLLNKYLRLSETKLPFKELQLETNEVTYLKHVGGKKHSDLKTKIFEEIQVLYEKVKRSDENFIAIGSVEDERLIKDLNKKAAGIKKADSIKEESKQKKKVPKRGKTCTLKKDEVREKRRFRTRQLLRK